MKLIRSVILLATLALSASANDISGTWKAWFVGPKDERPKMVSEMTFHLTVDGEKVTGMAHMDYWPGDAPISEGKIDGDRISFTVVGERPWWASGPMGEFSGYPKLVFVGKLHGKEAQLTLTWGSVMIKGESAREQTLEMRGKKVNPK
jgi:hypothetical protein